MLKFTFISEKFNSNHQAGQIGRDRGGWGEAKIWGGERIEVWGLHPIL